MDATRLSDGKTVHLKRVRKDTTEVAIALHFSTKELRSNPENHCVPIDDCITDGSDTRYDLLVMPLLRPFVDKPYSVTVGEAAEFVYQVLEVRDSHCHAVEQDLNLQC